MYKLFVLLCNKTKTIYRLWHLKLDCWLWLVLEVVKLLKVEVQILLLLLRRPKKEVWETGITDISHPRHFYNALVHIIEKKKALEKPRVMGVLFFSPFFYPNGLRWFCLVILSYFVFILIKTNLFRILKHLLVLKKMLFTHLWNKIQ